MDHLQGRSLLCPLVERCRCPCEAKIEESPGQFILYVHAEHTAEDHKEDKAKFLKYDTQVFIRKAVKGGALEYRFRAHEECARLAD